MWASLSGEETPLWIMKGNETCVALVVIRTGVKAMGPMISLSVNVVLEPKSCVLFLSGTMMQPNSASMVV